MAKLHVMALPQRTVSVGVYRVGDDRPRDGTSEPRMRPPLTPTDDEIKKELNDLFAQTGVSFTISPDSKPVRNVPFDDANYGAVDAIETDAIASAVDGFAAPRCIVLAEKSGTTSNPPFPRGMALGDAAGKGCIVFVADSGTYAPTIASHEIGHLLDLSFYGPPSGPGVSAAQAKHDNGPFPAGAESLMQNGNSTGRWLGHDDWRIANESVKNHLQ